MGKTLDPCFSRMAPLLEEWASGENEKVANHQIKLYYIITKKQIRSYHET